LLDFIGNISPRAATRGCCNQDQAQDYVLHA
jgi:hypothetical protein